MTIYVLSLYWLEHAGFSIGTPYTIEVYDGKLVLMAA
ncbi:SymE family type I addiction module toxin [Shewanella glacialipiscicola]